MTQYYFNLGTHKFPSGKPVIDLWQNIHGNAASYERLRQENALKADMEFINLSDNGNYENLLNCEHTIWAKLCDGIGWTVYGAVALSWCKDAELSQVWDGWEASGFPLKPFPEFERPARFINPALLPTTNSLLELARLAENKPLPICAMIVAKGDKLNVDLSVSMAAKASPQIAAFLKAHMERQANHTQEQTQMIEVWTQKVSGTEWEV